MRFLPRIAVSLNGLSPRKLKLVALYIQFITPGSIVRCTILRALLIYAMYLFAESFYRGLPSPDHILAIPLTIGVTAACTVISVSISCFGVIAIYRLHNRPYAS